MGDNYFDKSASRFGFDELNMYRESNSMQHLYLEMRDSLRQLYNEPIDAVFAFEDPAVKKQMWMSGVFDFESLGLNWDQAMISLHAVYADYPLLFFSDIYKTGGNLQRGPIIPLIDADSSQGLIRRFYADLIEKEIQRSISSVSLLQSKRTIAKLICETIIKNTRYDNNKGNSTYTKYVDIPSHSILDYIRKKSMVCQGYARTYQALMNCIDIPAISISVDAGGLHAVNLVYLDDEKKWIMVDVTEGSFDLKPGTYHQLSDEDRTMEFHKYEPRYHSIWKAYNEGNQH
jgi:hypothetical protein